MHVSFRYIRKAWCNADHPIEVPINNRRVARTIIAAIGSQFSGVVFSIEESTNKEAFLAFLKKLHGHLENLGQADCRPFLVLDNHTVSDLL